MPFPCAMSCRISVSRSVDFPVRPMTYMWESRSDSLMPKGIPRFRKVVRPKYVMVLSDKATSSSYSISRTSCKRKETDPGGHDIPSSLGAEVEPTSLCPDTSSRIAIETFTAGYLSSGRPFRTACLPIVHTRCYFGKHVSVALTYDSPRFMAVITHCHCSAVRLLAPFAHAWFITSCFCSLFHRSWLALSSIASMHNAVDWSC
jgi:hypothetical protein